MQNKLQLVLCYGMISPLTSIAYFSIRTACPTSHFTQSYQNNTTESQPKRFAFERKGTCSECLSSLGPFLMATTCSWNHLLVLSHWTTCSGKFLGGNVFATCGL